MEKGHAVNIVYTSLHIKLEKQATRDFQYLDLEETLDQVVLDIIDFISCSISTLL